MKIRTLAVALVLLLSALGAAAEHSTAVLSNEGVIYTLGPLPSTKLELVRRQGESRQSIIVPRDDMRTTVTAAEMAFDNASSTLFVVWHTEDTVNVSRLFHNGRWSEPLLIDLGGRRAGLELLLTRSGQTTLLHAAWWKLGSEDPVAEYALMAFEDGEHVSTFVAELNDFAGGTNSSFDYSDEIETMSTALHPPLAMAKTGPSGIDIVFGSSGSTRLTRIILDPKVRADARLWKPSRRGGGVTPRSGLMSANGDPVRAIVSEGRIILYTPDTKFRFVIYEKGRWSPERMIQLDESLTRDHLIEELRKAVEQLEIDDTPDEGVSE